MPVAGVAEHVTSCPTRRWHCWTVFGLSNLNNVLLVLVFFGRFFHISARTWLAYANHKKEGERILTEIDMEILEKDIISDVLYFGK